MTSENQNIQSAPENEIENETTPSSKNAKKASKKSKILRRTLIATGVFVALTGVGVGSILGTESGTKWALDFATRNVDGLSIGDVQGKLQNGLLLQNVQFQSDGVDTQIEQAQLQWDFSCLLNADICLENLSLKNPTIKINTALLPPSVPKKEEKSSPMERIWLPVSVAVKNVAVEKLNLHIDNNQISLGKFQSAVELNNKNGLTLSPTQINDLTYILTANEPTKVASVTSVTSNPEKQKENTPSEPVDWKAIEQSLTPALLGNVKEITLPFEMHIADISGKHWRYQQIEQGKKVQDIHISSLQLQADYTDNLAQLQKFQIQSSAGNIQAQGRFQLDQTFPVDLSVKADLQTLKKGNEVLLPKSNIDLTLSGNLKKNTALSLKTQGVANGNLTAEVKLNEEKTPLNVTANVAKFQFPFNPTSDPLNVENATLNIKGNLLDYTAHLKGGVKGLGIPNTQVELQGKGELSQAKVEKLQLNALDGTLALKGDVNWKDGVEWQSAVDLNRINVGAYVRDFPAQLSGKLASSGRANAQGWHIEVPELDVKGSLSQRPLSLKGTLTSNNKNLLNTPQLLLNYGNNQILAKGQLAQEKSDFFLDINAPSLQGLVPNLSGSIVGKAYLKGKIAEPQMDVDLTGNQIKFQDLSISRVVAKGKVNTLDQIQGDLNVDLTGFKQGDIQLQNAKLTASGSEKSHQLQLRSKGEPVAGGLNLSGNFDRTSQRWQGVLSQVNISTPLGDVKNNQNINVQFDNKQTLATISSHCWSQTDIDLCFPQAFKAGKNGEIPFEIKRFNLSAVNKLAKQDGLLKGILRSTGKFAWAENKPVKLEIQVNGDNINVAQKIDYRTFKLAVPKLQLNANLDNNNLTAKTDIFIQNNGKIQLDAKITDIVKARKLGGTLNIDGVNLNLANQLLSSGEKISGDVVSKLSFGGDLNAPLLNGAFNINNIKAKMKSSPVEVTGGNVALNFHGNGSTLKGNVQTPDGSLNLNGDANWKDLNRWNARLQAEGDKFLVNIPSMAKVRVSPNITLKATPTLLDLSGNVDIPWARIAIESLPDSAVTVSDDEVILDPKFGVKNQNVMASRQMAATTKSGMAIQSDLKINIGDDVKIKAYGLDSELVGKLMVRQEKGKLGLFGRIDLKNGRYSSFGQDLLIRKGQISFAGLPSQPLLDIKAVRNPEAMENSKIVAGVKVTGVADSPSVEVFAEPSMSQDQALSYLLTGRSLETSGDAGSSGSVGAALLGLGLSKSGKLVGSIGETFGIQDLNLGTAGVGESSKVVVSGNITPRLKIKYGVGLFDGLAEVTLRYRLLPQLFLQSVSGVNQAFDILYEFEF